VVDVASGTQLLSLEFAQRRGPEARVVAVDPWAAAMSRLERKCRYLGISNIDARTRDAVNTGLPDRFADLVVSNLGVNNFADPERVLAECRRLLKPGGRLFLTTNLEGHMSELYAAYRNVAAALGRVDILPRLAAHEAHRGSVASVCGLLRHAGFTDISEEVDSFAMRFADGTALFAHWFIRVGFLPAWRELAGGRDTEVVLARLEQQLNALAADAGELSLTIPVALFSAMVS
jgi:SAM-dependent methyltransferase